MSLYPGVPSRPAATRGALGAVELAELASDYAERVLAGLYPQLRFDRNHRRHERIHQDGRADVWLITWMPARSLPFLPHAGEMVP